MEKLIEKIEKLKKVLDNNEKVKEFLTSKKEIEKNKELIEQIRRYNETLDEELKQQIITNKKFREYKKKETNINLIILEINQQLKQISKRGNCEK